MIKIKMSVFLGLAIILIGCDKNPNRSLNNGFVNELNTYLEEKQIKDFCLLNDRGFDPKTNKCVDSPSTTKEDKLEAARKSRNNFVEKTTLIIDANYAEFINALAQGRSEGNFIADLIELSTSAVIGVVDNVDALQVLGVTLTAFRGARNSFDLNFYQQQTTPILINTMDDTRNRVYTIILQKKERGIEQYSLNEAMKDIVNYYNSGTLVRAFAELSKKAALASVESEQKVLVVQGLVPRSLSSEPTRAEIKRASDITSKLATYLRGSDKKEIDNATKVVKKIFEKLTNNNDFKKLYGKEIDPLPSDPLPSQVLAQISLLDTITRDFEYLSVNSELSENVRSQYATLVDEITNVINSSYDEVYLK